MQLLADPYLLLHLGLAAGLLWLWRSRTTGRRPLLAVTALWLALLVISLPAVAFLAAATLEWGRPYLEAPPGDSEAIVVLGGYVRPPDATRSRPEIGEDSLRRCLRAAELQRQAPGCLVLVSGGKVDPQTPGPSVAGVMAEMLERLGVDRAQLVTEDRSRTTYENAVETSRLLRDRGVNRVLLVTEAMHLPRAIRCFEAQGIRVVAAGCQHRARGFRWELASFLPSPSAADVVRQVAHEWLGLAYYAATGKT